MNRILLIKHEDLTEENRLKIIEIKAAFGDYSMESQSIWLDKNLKETDLHFMVFSGSKLISYMNLIDIKVSVNGIIHKGFGVGNVCSLEKNKGYGNILMQYANEFIKEKDRIGLLFCKSEVLKFYTKNKWEVVGRDVHKMFEDNSDLDVLVFNHLSKISDFLYMGEIF